MILPRTKPCRKECPMPKKLEGYHSGRGRPYNPYRNHSLQLQYATLEERTQPTGAYIYYIILFISYIFSLINYSLRDPHYIRPRIFIFATPLATHIRDSHFATHTRDSHSRLTFRDSHSRLQFATPIRNSNS